MKATYPDLKNKIIAITGAGEGIGKAIAKAFLSQGSYVILISRNDISWLKKLKKSNYLFIKKDIQDINFFKSWLSEFHTNGKTIDILINNAAVIQEQPLMDVTEDAWNHIMNINTKSNFFLTQAFAKYMIKAKNGNIIFASSFAAKLSSYPFGLYAATKSIIGSLSKSLAAELAQYNIRVNSYSPGVIETKMTKNAIYKNKEKMLESISVQRFGTAQEVANAVLFLASESSDYINGFDLEVNGGKFLIQNFSSIIADS